MNELWISTYNIVLTVKNVVMCTSKFTKKVDLMLNVLTTHTHKTNYSKFYTMGFYTSIIYLFLHVLSHMSLDAQDKFGKC